MPNRYKFIIEKLKSEAQWIVALSKFAVGGRHLENKLSKSIPGLTIETVNICNADCIFCGYQYQQRPSGVMSEEIYEKSLRDYVDCGGGPLSLSPTVGDPLIDPDIIKRIRLARSHAAITRIGFYSNLISLKKTGAEALVESGLTDLSISIGGFDREMYKRVYRSGQYERVFNNIKELAELNNSAGRPIRIGISMRIDRPISEVAAMNDYKAVADLLGEENIFANAYFDDWSGRIKQDDLSGTMRLRSGSFIHKTMFSLRRPRISPCSEMFSGPMIYWNGKVGACGCRDVNADQLIIGDIGSEHLGRIWFGREIKELRAEFLGPCGKDICRECSHYNNLAIYLRPDRRDELEKIRPSPLADI